MACDAASISMQQICGMDGNYSSCHQNDYYSDITYCGPFDVQSSCGQQVCWSAQTFCKLNGQCVKDNPIDASLSPITQNETPVTDTFWNRIYTVLKNIYDYGKYGTRNPAVKREVEKWYKEYYQCSEKIETENPYGNCNSYYGEYNNSCYENYYGGYYGSGSGYYAGNTMGYDPKGPYRIYKTTQTVDDIVTNVKDNDPILQSLYNKILSLISVSNISGQPVITKSAMDQLQTQINNYKLNSNRCNDCNTSCNVGCEASCECSDEGDQAPADCSQGGGGDCGGSQTSCNGTQFYFYGGDGGCGMSGSGYGDGGGSTGGCGWAAATTQ